MESDFETFEKADPDKIIEQLKMFIRYFQEKIRRMKEHEEELSASPFS